MVQKIRVVAGVLTGTAGWVRAGGGGCSGWVEGAVLLARRRPELRQGGLWELPGGKIEAGEEPEAALVREIAEELALHVRVGAFVALHEHDYGRGPIVLEAWRAEIVGGVMRLTDHDAVAWVKPADLTGWALAAADIPIAQLLAARG